MISITRARQLTMDAMSASAWSAQIEEYIKNAAQRGEWGIEISSRALYARFMTDEEFRNELYSQYPEFVMGADPNGSSVFISWYDQVNPPGFSTGTEIQFRAALDRAFNSFKNP